MVDLPQAHAQHGMKACVFGTRHAGGAGIRSFDVPAARCGFTLAAMELHDRPTPLGYSKKYENHCPAVALFIAHFNFCRIHSTHGQTPAEAAGLTDHAWTVEELLLSI